MFNCGDFKANLAKLKSPLSIPGANRIFWQDRKTPGMQWRVWEFGAFLNDTAAA
jgi:hypothetical protein